MPLKPVRSWPDLSKEICQTAIETAASIESLIIKFANAQYRNDFRVERFTEIEWRVYLKSLERLSPSKYVEPVFYVEIGEIPHPFSDWVLGKDGDHYLYVFFNQRHNLPQLSKDDILQFCQELNIETGLRLRCDYGVDRFYVPSSK